VKTTNDGVKATNDATQNQDHFATPPAGPKPLVTPSTSTLLSPEENLLELRRQLIVAERALDGLEKLATYYVTGSEEFKRTCDSINQQKILLENLKGEEEKLDIEVNGPKFTARPLPAVPQKNYSSNYDDYNDYTDYQESTYSKPLLEIPVYENEWYQYKTDDGYPYYHNYHTGETVWQIPHKEQPIFHSK